MFEKRRSIDGLGSNAGRNEYDAKVDVVVLVVVVIGDVRVKLRGNKRRGGSGGVLRQWSQLGKARCCLGGLLVTCSSGSVSPDGW
jgi:hypothetical protein